MRQHGLVDAPAGLGPHGHGCWGYDRLDDLAAAAGAFLAEGAELGLRLMFVGGAEAEQVVRGVEPMRTMLRAGRLEIAPFAAIYPGGHRMDNGAQLDVYADATKQALAAGFRGLRILAEVTALVGSADGWCAHAAWESLVDRYMAVRPLSALCCFGRRALPDAALSAIACMHPVADRSLQRLVPFHVYAQPDGLALAGEVDAFSAPGLGRLLGLATDHDRADVILDLDALRFIDHNGVLAIQRHARSLREQGRHLMLRGQTPTFRRLAELLGGLQ